MPYIKQIPRLPQRAAQSNKGDFGRVLVIAGSRGMAGAACLAARAAYRGGAGLVRLAVPESIWDIVAIKTDECLTLGLPETKRGSISYKAWKDLAESLEWADVIVAGPGLTQDESTVELILRLVEQTPKALVLDADALNAIAADQTKTLRRAQEGAHAARQVLLTPHPGEMGRLCGKPTKDVQTDRAGTVLEVAQTTHAVVVLKGAGTLVSDGARLYENTTGNAGMAKGGTGDVLAGLAGALVAQKMSAFDAGCLSVYLHGMAGDLAAARLSQWSMLASDLLEELPNAFLNFSKAQD